MHIKDFATGSMVLSQLMIRHVFRTKLIYLVVGFSVLTQIAGLKVIHQGMSGSVGLLPVLKSHHSVFVLLFLELFGGVLLATVYGVWVVPYLHTGPRAQLTFVLPVNRVGFAIAAVSGLWAMLLVQVLCSLAVFGWVMGVGDLALGVFPWSYFFWGVCFEWLSFTSIMFLFSALSVGLGPVTSFFIGIMILCGLQFVGVLKALGLFLASKGIETGFLDWTRGYDLLLPVGELVFHLKLLSTDNFGVSGAVTKWLVWLLLLAVGYLYSISRLRRFKAGV